MLRRRFMRLPLFSTIVASWNALTDSNNNIELMVRVRVDGAWSNYFHIEHGLRTK